MTNPPPVAPVVTDEMVEIGLHKWFESEGEQIADLKADADIWNIYQRDMRAAITAALEASGELERLRAAAKLALKAFYHAAEWSGTSDFDHEIAALESALDKLTGEK